LLGSGVICLVVLNSSLFGLLDHFVWASFFRIWAREHIAQLGFLCVWLGLEERFFFLQLLCAFPAAISFSWHGSFPRILGVAVRLSDQFHVAHKFLP
jgi:xanthosine utilization system XapX-like protein